jgi:hypothetical protein
MDSEVFFLLDTLSSFIPQVFFFSPPPFLLETLSSFVAQAGHILKRILYSDFISRQFTCALTFQTSPPPSHRAVVGARHWRAGGSSGTYAWSRERLAHRVWHVPGGRR